MSNRLEDQVRKSAFLLSRWWPLVFFIILASLAAAYYWTQEQTPLYRTTATVEVQYIESDDITGDIEVYSNPEIFYDTQLFRLRSKVLIEEALRDGLSKEKSRRVIERNLEGVSEAASVRNIQNDLTVAFLDNSQIIELAFLSSDPEYAALIPNLIVTRFEENYRGKVNDAFQLENDGLENELADAKAKLEVSEKELAAYSRKKDLLSLPYYGNGNAGQTGNAISITAERKALETLKEDARAAKTKRLEQERFNFIMLSGSDNALLENEPSMLKLFEEKRLLEASYDEKALSFKEDYPEMLALRQQIVGVEDSIDAEYLRLVHIAQLKLEEAVASENSLNARIKETEKRLTDIQDASVKYNRIKRDVTSNLAEYEGLLQRLKEKAAAGESRQSSITILDKAMRPVDSVYPVLSENLFKAGSGATLISLLFVFMFSIVNDKVSSPEAVPKRLGLPVLGVIPILKVKNLIEDLFDNPLSIASEAYSTTRTKIRNLELENGEPQCIQVTSTRAGEGKSVTSLALARSYAIVGKKTLLIDADFRLPTFENPTKDSIGLAGLLENGGLLRDQISSTKLKNLYLLSAGKEPEDPARLLASGKLVKILTRLRKTYDKIIIDSPPVLGLSDALLLAGISDASIIVTQSNAVPARSVALTIEALEPAAKQILGMVMTKYKPSHGRHNKHYTKYTYGKQATSYGNKSDKGLLRPKAKKKIDLI